MSQGEQDKDLVVVTTDGTEIRCRSFQEGGQGLILMSKSGSQLGYIPYNMLQAVYPIEFSQHYSPQQ